MIAPRNLSDTWRRCTFISTMHSRRYLPFSCFPFSSLRIQPTASFLQSQGRLLRKCLSLSLSL